MPYSANKELPESIKKLPDAAQSLFRQVFNKSLESYSEDVSFRIAWESVKRKFKKVDGAWIAKGLSLDFYSFSLEVEDKNVFVQKGEDGEYYLEAALSDTMYDTQGKRFTEEALQAYAEQINNVGLAGFITHEDWNNFKRENMHLSEEAFVAKARTERKGILKTVKAIYEKGKLWIKALIDKRYLNHVRKFNKVSIEALVPRRFQSSNEYHGGYVLGFALDNNAVNRRAVAQVVNE
jgi:cation transport regulator ChaB